MTLDPTVWVFVVIRE